MPNWSSCYTKFSASGIKAKVLEELYEKMKTNGFEISKKFSIPRILDCYPSPLPNQCSKEEWMAYVKSGNAKKDMECNGFFSIIKESVASYLQEKELFDWYAWANSNWGTKWNTLKENSSIELSTDGDETIVECEYSGAWNGANIWFLKVCEAYGFNGVYVDMEPGNGFFHKIVVKEQVVEETEDDYFSEESIKWCGKDYFIEEYDGIYEHESDENWTNENSEFIKKFAQLCDYSFENAVKHLSGEKDEL